MEFIGLMLTSLLLVLHHSSAYAAHQQGRKIVKGNMVVPSQENMGLGHHDSSVAVDGRHGLGGRKMVAKKVPDMEEKGLNGASSAKKIPEEINNDVSMESVRGQQHPWKAQKGEVSVGKRGESSENDRRNIQPEEEENDNEEVMNLMRRDYRQKNPQRRKPPINNHQLHH